MTKYPRIKALALAEPTSVSTKPSVLCSEASWSVLVFDITVIKNTNKQILNCPIEHLEEEEFKVKHQNSISTTSTIVCIFMHKHVDLIMVGLDEGNTGNYI